MTLLWRSAVVAKWPPGGTVYQVGLCMSFQESMGKVSNSWECSEWIQAGRYLSIWHEGCEVSKAGSSTAEWTTLTPFWACRNKSQWWYSHHHCCYEQHFCGHYTDYETYTWWCETSTSTDTIGPGPLWHSTSVSRPISTPPAPDLPNLGSGMEINSKQYKMVLIPIDPNSEQSTSSTPPSLTHVPSEEEKENIVNTIEMNVSLSVW